MNSGVQQQKESFENIYTHSKNWEHWDSKDPLTRYLLDRRLQIGVDHLMERTNSSPADWDVLVLCGGVGGEGTVLANMGFRSVTVSDISENALQVCKVRDPRLKTQVLNGEKLEVADGSYDLVLVQDGLHHLPRPVLGLTEMLRVAKKAAIVIEPHAGIVANLLGTVWEDHGGTVNYVFRWNELLLEQATRSYLLQSPCYVKALRLWNHNIVMSRFAKKLWNKQAGLQAVKLSYLLLDLLFGKVGNMMIGVVIKNP
ncbi:class I SAM-dependent methyltransferase [Phormidium pseudopriestleyi FRX01]|uniref:Class I SAM-dependent methyltransferase n=1 Tax=Phormidium pseudopriestleyi FRX01 TaxID=1759528 RepID=A0ABS3FMZ8_9CYAN|nr:class I SAM-dependent methyltransferase [Phormidium pseudopriestleyi]MBO0348026.1 class I SAM-dependent methyltransferase [Phormidium pseudopriestleyi FRX01]